MKPKRQDEERMETVMFSLVFKGMFEFIEENKNFIS
jgi:hypothetical protein